MPRIISGWNAGIHLTETVSILITCIILCFVWLEIFICFDANMMDTLNKCYSKSNACRIYNDLGQTLIMIIVAHFWPLYYQKYPSKSTSGTTYCTVKQKYWSCLDQMINFAEKPTSLKYELSIVCQNRDMQFFMYALFGYRIMMMYELFS
jgi:hypothetical protein